MKVLICGAGIAGLTLAWWLERSGWDVELVERAPAFRHGGYMIDFYGAGYQVAEQMGMHPRLHDLRYPVSGLSYLDRNGRQTSRLDTPPSFDSTLVSLLRGDLARVIHDEVRAPVRYHTSVEGVEQTNDGVIVRLTDGSRREVDLLVGADGVHSRVRELVFGPEQRFFRYLGHHVASWVVTNENLNREVGMRYHAMVVPGMMAGAYALRDDRIALLLLRREVDPTLPDDPAAALRRHFGDLDWIIPDVLRRCPQPPELYYDQVAQIEMDRWSRGRVVLLGDACGAPSLFAGHGASMAVAAAWMLTDELRRADGELPTTLARYQRRMQPTIAEVQQLGRRTVKWMAPSSRSRIVALNWIMRLATLPGVDRLLFRSLSPGGSHTLIPSRRAVAEKSERQSAGS